MKNIIIIGILIIISCVSAWSGSVKLELDPNSETNLAGYYLYRAERIDDHTLAWVKIAIIAKDITTYIDEVDEKNYAWLITAFDTGDNESFVSNMVERYSRTSPGMIENLRHKVTPGVKQ